MNADGVHTLRSYSTEPLHLAAAFGDDWHTARGDVYVRRLLPLIHSFANNNNNNNKQNGGH